MCALRPGSAHMAATVREFSNKEPGVSGFQRNPPAGVKIGAVVEGSRDAVKAASGCELEMDRQQLQFTSLILSGSFTAIRALLVIAGTATSILIFLDFAFIRNCTPAVHKRSRPRGPPNPPPTKTSSPPAIPKSSQCTEN